MDFFYRKYFSHLRNLSFFFTVVIVFTGCQEVEQLDEAFTDTFVKQSKVSELDCAKQMVEQLILSATIQVGSKKKDTYLSYLDHTTLQIEIENFFLESIDDSTDGKNLDAFRSNAQEKQIDDAKEVKWVPVVFTVLATEGLDGKKYKNALKLPGRIWLDITQHQKHKPLSGELESTIFVCEFNPSSFWKKHEIFQLNNAVEMKLFKISGKETTSRTYPVLGYRTFIEKYEEYGDTKIKMREKRDLDIRYRGEPWNPEPNSQSTW